MNLLTRLDLSSFKHIFGVGTTENDTIRSFMKEPNFTFIKADILEPNTYVQYLQSSDIVIHMAAMTGKASREAYFRINRDGTHTLLASCQEAKIGRFIFISSIAATFHKIKYYYYAQSKIAAEEDIKNSGIPYTILRPTIVIGEGSPVLMSFKKMIEPPLVPIFGDGRAEIQPIFVGDLVHYILHVINHDRFMNKTIEVGGPERIRIESFIKNLHYLTKKGTFRSIHLPITFFSTILAILEKYFLNLLPFTAGQLASFSNDGTLNENSFKATDGLAFIGINEMLARSLKLEDAEMFKIEALRRECGILSHYLINSDVNEYTVDKYIQGHIILNIRINNKLIDRILIKNAIKSSFSISLADVYSSVFYPHAIIRKKILLLIAILECQALSYGHLDSIDEKSKFRLFVKLGKKAISFLVILTLSIILIGPFHAVSYFTERPVVNK